MSRGFYVGVVSWVRDRRCAWVPRSSYVRKRPNGKSESWPAASLVFRLGRCLAASRLSPHPVH